MAENDTEVLTSEKAIPLNILPTGRKVGYVPVRGLNMYELRYVDGKPGALPEECNGRFTSIKLAEQAIRNYVSGLWEISDRSGKKKTSPNTHNAVG